MNCFTLKTNDQTIVNGKVGENPAIHFDSSGLTVLNSIKDQMESYFLELLDNCAKIGKKKYDYMMTLSPRMGSIEEPARFEEVENFSFIHIYSLLCEMFDINVNHVVKQQSLPTGKTYVLNHKLSESGLDYLASFYEYNRYNVKAADIQKQYENFFEKFFASQLADEPDFNALFESDNVYSQSSSQTSLMSISPKFRKLFAIFLDDSKDQFRPTSQFARFYLCLPSIVEFNQPFKVKLLEQNELAANQFLNIQDLVANEQRLKLINTTFMLDEQEPPSDMPVKPNELISIDFDDLECENLFKN
jgi:hypothetical protein